MTTFEPIYRDGEGKVEYHYVVLEYWAHYLGGDPFPQDDVVAAAWVDRTDLTTYSLTPEQIAILEKSYAAWYTAPPPASHTFTNLPTLPNSHMPTNL